MTIYTGERIRLKAIVKDNAGTATAADAGTVKVDLYDPDGTKKISHATGTFSTGTTATYYAFVSIPEEDTNGDKYETGDWTHVWFASITDGSERWDMVEAKAFEVKRQSKP